MNQQHFRSPLLVNGEKHNTLGGCIAGASPGWLRDMRLESATVPRMDELLDKGTRGDEKVITYCSRNHMQGLNVRS